MNKAGKMPSQTVNLKKSRNNKELTGNINVLSGKWYQLLFNNVSDAVFVHWGPDETSMPGKFIEVNEVACSRLGYTREELLEMKPSDIDAPETISKVPLVMEKLLKDKQALWEGIHVSKNREKIPVEIHNRLFDFDGRKLILSTVRDISERKRAETQLKESEEKYRLVVENAREAIVVTQDFRLVFINHAAETLTGYSEDIFTSRPFSEFIHPDDRNMVIENHIKRLNGEESPPIYAYRIISRDGSTKWAETNSIRIQWKGRPADLSFLKDITERKITEEALHNSEQLLRLITNNVQDAVRIVDLQSLRYTYANSYCQKLFGVTANEYIHSEVGSNLDAEEKKRLFDILQDELEHDQERDPSRHRFFELQERKLLNNEIIWTENKASFIRDTNGKPTAVISITRDISERKRMEEERQNLQERVRRAEKMEALGQLAGGVAHDLNNVLGALSGYSELLLLSIPEGQKARGFAEKILQSTERGAAIIQDLLTSARRGVAVPGVISLNDVVSGFIKTPVFEKIKAYHPLVTFKTECDDNLLNINGSAVHLEKVLMNLIANASEAITGAGEVMIRTESRYLDKTISGYDKMNEGDYAVLIVSDTGMGISAEDKEKIFEPFYTKKTLGRSGTGLGLTIVWGTVKDHNGYIDVQSEVNEGTTFMLYFPTTREELIAPLQKLPIERYMGSGKIVLVVDDIGAQRDVASGLLKRLGYVVYAVSSGEEAVEYLKRNRADILVLDMIMPPGIDGLETYKRILEIKPKQKAILVSGFSETDRVIEAQKLGAGAYVKKPYVMEKIGIAIQDELNR